MEKQVVFDRIEEEKAVFITADKQEIIIPKDFLSEEIKPGQMVWLQINTDQTATNNQKDLAKQMLNEIISDNSSNENA